MSSLALQTKLKRRLNKHIQRPRALAYAPIYQLEYNCMYTDHQLCHNAVKSFNERVLSNLAVSGVNPTEFMVDIHTMIPETWVSQLAEAEQRWETWVLKYKASIGWYTEHKDMLQTLLRIAQAATSMDTVIEDFCTIGNVVRWAAEAVTPASSEEDPRDGLTNTVYHCVTESEEIYDTLHVYGGMRLSGVRQLELRWSRREDGWACTSIAPSLLTELVPYYEVRVDTFPVMDLPLLIHALQILIRRNC